MKPIFEEERVFLNELLGINLPSECWRNSSKIYLDLTCDKPIYIFKVEDGEAYITKDNSELFTNHKQKSIKELIEIYSNRLDELAEESLSFCYNYINQHQDNDLFVVSHSGGKDSTLQTHFWLKALDKLQGSDKELFNKVDSKWHINFCNTSNDVADTYKLVKKLPRLVIQNPKEGYYQWIKRKNYFLPSVTVRNCCSTYKEGQINKYYDKNQKINMVIGIRKHESVKRAKYDWIVDYDYAKEIFGTPNFSENWIKVCPIVEWKDEEVWLYMLREEIEFNRLYRLGFQRVGCLCCPYQSNYNDLLIKNYYSDQWDRWLKIVAKNYENTGVAKRLKWTLKEYQDGKWKQGTSKVQELLKLKRTDERVEQLAELLGVDEITASKYWDRICDCGKKLNPTEIAMYLKMYGRYDGVELDERKYMCKKCMCKELGIKPKEYQAKYLEFREGGCNLF